jgi:hypothetical protein
MSERAGLEDPARRFAVDTLSRRKAGAQQGSNKSGDTHGRCLGNEEKGERGDERREIADG